MVRAGLGAAAHAHQRAADDAVRPGLPCAKAQVSEKVQALLSRFHRALKIPQV